MRRPDIVDDNLIQLIEVGPRDGLQNETVHVPTTTKIAFINQLSTTGLRHIEVTSFVAPAAIPALADHDTVMRGIDRRKNITYTVLVPNLQGYTAAVAATANQVAVFTAASESFNLRNIHCTIAESLQRFEPIFKQARADGIPVRAYLSCVFACPTEGLIQPKQVIPIIEKLIDMGAYEVSLGDTIGVGTITQVRALLSSLTQSISPQQLAVHFHNTYGQALVNIVEALHWQIRSIDCAVAGLGGCPYARGATGNVATEDVIYTLHGMGLKTGVDLVALLQCGDFICKALEKSPVSFLGKAGLRK